MVAFGQIPEPGVFAQERFQGFFVEGPDLEAAWQGLARHLRENRLGDGSDLAQAHNGEVWQYMGSGESLHFFRHRDHPKAGRRLNVRIPREGSQ